MSPRPIYGILVEDFIDHIEWTLARDNTEVATGRVDLDAYTARPEVSAVGMAFARAWQEANHERVTRFLDDLHDAHAQARAEHALDIAHSELVRADAEEVGR